MKACVSCYVEIDELEQICPYCEQAQPKPISQAEGYLPYNRIDTYWDEMFGGFFSACMRCCCK